MVYLGGRIPQGPLMDHRFAFPRLSGSFWWVGCGSFRDMASDQIVTCQKEAIQAAEMVSALLARILGKFWKWWWGAISTHFINFQNHLFGQHNRSTGSLLSAAGSPFAFGGAADKAWSGFSLPLLSQAVEMQGWREAVSPCLTRRSPVCS